MLRWIWIWLVLCIYVSRSYVQRTPHRAAMSTLAALQASQEPLTHNTENTAAIHKKTVLLIFTENCLRFHDHPMLVAAEEAKRRVGSEGVDLCPLLFTPTATYANTAARNGEDDVGRHGDIHMSPSLKMHSKQLRLKLNGCLPVLNSDLLQKVLHTAKYDNDAKVRGNRGNTSLEAWYMHSDIQPYASTLEKLCDVLHTAGSNAVKVRVFHDCLLPFTSNKEVLLDGRDDVKYWRFQGNFDKQYAALLRPKDGTGPKVALPRMNYGSLEFCSLQKLGCYDVVTENVLANEDVAEQALGCEDLAVQYLKDYLKLADDDAFSQQHLQDYLQQLPSSEKHALSLRRLSKSTKYLFEGEVVNALLTPLLAQGLLSPKLLIHARSVFLVGAQKWFSSRPVYRTLQALAVRRDWHLLLARTMQQRQAKRQAELVQHVAEDVKLWNTSYQLWRGFITRHGEMCTPEKGKKKPLLFLIHGFGASIDQYTGLANELVEDFDVYALDSLGFGHGEKPPLSYNQYLWRDQVVDFIQSKCQERVNEGDEELSVFIAGNSIGGYSATAAAATLAKNNVTVSNSRTLRDMRIQCQGLVLFNPSGTLRSDGTASLRGDLELLPEYKGVQSNLLQLFGKGVFSLLQPRIRQACEWMYPTHPNRVTDASWDRDSLADSILRDSSDPGAADVIAAGGKLPTPVTMDQFLHVYQGPVLIAQGVLDPLNNAKSRAMGFGKIRPTIDVEMLALGHCPMDEDAVLVAQKVKKWFRRIKNNETNG